MRRRHLNLLPLCCSLLLPLLLLLLHLLLLLLVLIPRFLSWWLHRHRHIQQLDNINTLCTIHYRNTHSRCVRLQQNRLTRSIKVQNQLKRNNTHSGCARPIRESLFVCVYLNASEQLNQHVSIATFWRFSKLHRHFLFIIFLASVKRGLIPRNVA